MPNYRIELAGETIISVRETRSIITEDLTYIHDGQLLFAIMQAATENEARTKVEQVLLSMESEKRNVDAL